MLFILSVDKVSATHYYGVDLFYTHVAGNTYRVTFVAYGDCSGSLFPSFATMRPLVHIMKGNNEVLSDFLEPEPPREGVEVTPVCPAELNNTTCVNVSGSVPGVKKFVYSKEFTLNGTAPDWKFVFKGYTDGTSIAGRSNSLTNVAPPGIIRVEATLDNTKNNNSSPEYTTIATPFYCINKPVNFNPGAVDKDGDSLVYELVNALDTSTFVAYRPGFSPTNPLIVASGKFVFSNRTGQLSFTASNIQRSLVVYRVSEYRNGVKLGSSMREMTVVIMDCDNSPPNGYIASVAGANLVDSVTVTTCGGNHELAFDINPGDADNGHIINMAANGLPGNARLEIINNNTASPKSRFVWDMPELAKGSYSFFVTYTDNGCPLASKQTQAYTIRIAPDEISSISTPAVCMGKGTIQVTAPAWWVPWDYSMYLENTSVYNKRSTTASNWSDSLAAGKYVIKAVNYFGCTAETEAEIAYTCEIAEIPNAFSPNGDGNNDILYVIGANVLQMDMRIYNRWGQLIFESNNVATGWDGKYKGADSPMDAYAFVLSGVFKSGNVFHKQGNITLIR